MFWVFKVPLTFCGRLDLDFRGLDDFPSILWIFFSILTMSGPRRLLDPGGDGKSLSPL